MVTRAIVAHEVDLFERASHSAYGASRSFRNPLLPLTFLALRYIHLECLRLRVQHYLPRLLRINGYSVGKVSEGDDVRVALPTLPILPVCFIFSQVLLSLLLKRISYGGSFLKPHFLLALLPFVYKPCVLCQYRLTPCDYSGHAVILSAAGADHFVELWVGATYVTN